MSEHSEHYHDADRNKPLPGATVSSEEEVLQTLLTAAHGEITALTEANKLLAAQVAGSADLSIKWAVRELLSSLPERRDWLNPDVERELRDFLGGTAKVSARAADAPSEPSSAETDQLVGAMYALRCIANGEAIDPIGCAKLALKVIDSIHSRAADAPSEPSDIIALIEKAQKISPSMATRCYELTPLQVAWIIGKSRAADALDSQPKTGLLDKFIAEADAAGITHLNLAALDSKPTEPATRNIRAAAFDEALAVAKEQSKFFADHSRHELAAAVDQVFAHIQRRKLSSSQPTDGEVRK